jgi:methyltransferase (TIGR00027 family)
VRVIDGAPPVARTAFWTAFCRAEEANHPRPLVVDPLAERLCGREGLAIGRAMEAEGAAHASVVVRTRIFDERIAVAVALDGAREVVLLGAGLDARAHRLALGRDVRFVEADFAEVLAWKRARLAEHESGAVNVEQRPVDLTDADAVDALLTSLGDRSRVLVLEGVLAYLTEPQVRALLAAIARAPGRNRVLADVGGGAWSALFGGRIRGVAGRRGAPYRTQLARARAFFERAGYRVEADISLVAWDAARSEPRFRIPWSARLVGGLNDVARVIDAVPAAPSPAPRP